MTVDVKMDPVSETVVFTDTAMHGLPLVHASVETHMLVGMREKKRFPRRTYTHARKHRISRGIYVHS